MVKKPNAMQNLFLMQDVMLSTPSDLLYEAYVFEQYLLILERIDQRMNSQTTLEEDLKLLSDDDLHWKMRMSVTYRVGKKQLIRSQINIVKKTLDVITTMKELLDTDEMNADTEMQNKAYTDLLLLETTYEQQQKKEAKGTKDTRGTEDHFWSTVYFISLVKLQIAESLSTTFLRFICW